jgi:predicted metal-dependent HD superfamily phosphohydrolase
VAILIDPPLWPAHGTHFSHLVSDSSLAELHRFAAAAGIRERAFDRDHYDVPVSRYRELVELGAFEVSAGELTRRLQASGLRVPARQRPEKLRRVLLRRWNELLPGQEDLGRALLERWAEPHRHYHGPGHLLAVLEALGQLAPPVGSGLRPRAVWLAAWFHDAVYNGRAGQDEQDSADLAAASLPTAGVGPDETAEVVRLVLLTAEHSPGPQDESGALLCDADLAVLGGAPAEYRSYVRAVRQDYAHVADADFAAGRTAVVRRLLELDPLYRTPAARAKWLDSAKRNLTAELDAWRLVGPEWLHADRG